MSRILKYLSKDYTELRQKFYISMDTHGILLNEKKNRLDVEHFIETIDHIVLDQFENHKQLWCYIIFKKITHLDTYK